VQAGQELFHIASPTPSQRSLRRDEEVVARYTATYEHAEPGLNLYNQTVAADLDPGQHRGFVNLLFADQEACPHQLTVEALGETAARITNRETGEAMVVAVGDDGENRIGEIVWRGRLVCVSPGTIVLAGGTDLSVSGQALFHSEQPLSVELDLNSGRAVVVATAETALELIGEKRRMDKGRTVLKVPSPSELAAAVVRAVDALGPQPPASEAAPPIETLRSLWKIDASGPVLALAVGDVSGNGTPDVAFGSMARLLGVVSGEGRLLWSHRARGAVGTVAIFDLDGDGAAEVVAGNDDDKICTYSQVRHVRTVGFDGENGPLTKADESRVSAFSGDGKLLWETRIDYGNPTWCWWTLHSSNIRKVVAADLDGDGKGEIYAGCGNMQLYRLSHDGKIDWNFRTDHGVVTRMVTADADGDGKRELIAGCHSLSAASVCWVLGADGECKSTWIDEYWTSALTAIQVADLDGDGKPVVLNGTKKGNLYAHTLPSREVLWQVNFGDTVTDLGLVPAVSGKGLDIIVSSATGYVTRLDAAGNRLWATALPDEVLCLTVLDQGSEGRIVCGCEDGAVYVLRLDGSMVGRVETGGRVRCVAALEPHRAVAGSDDGFLYGLRVP